MNNFIKGMVVVASIALLSMPVWGFDQGKQQPQNSVFNGQQVTSNVGGDTPFQLVSNRGYYRSYGRPYGYGYGYGWNSNYYRPYYGYRYYGAPRAGYYDYGYGRGAVRVGPVQVWW